MVVFDKITNEEKIKLANKMLSYAKKHINNQYPMNQRELAEAAYFGCKIAANDMQELLMNKANLKLD